MPGSIFGLKMQQIYASLVYYPTLVWNMLLGRILGVRNWWDAVDQHVFIGAVPLRSDVQKLADAGISAVVNTCEEFGGPTAEYQRLGIEQLHIPTIDFAHPSHESVVAGVEFIERHVQAGHRVYVHCKAGRGRSATIVVCWLIRHYGMSADQAQAFLLNVRPHVNRHIANRPVVRRFEQEFHKMPN